MIVRQEAGQVLLVAEGKAVEKCISVAEILKRTQPLHQVSNLSLYQREFLWKQTTRLLMNDTSKSPIIRISFLREATADNKKDPSYQAPLSPEEAQKLKDRAPLTAEGTNPSSTKRKKPLTPLKELQPKRGRRGTLFTEELERRSA